MKRSIAAWNQDDPVELNARRVLPELMHKYFKAGRRLDRDAGAKAMHRFRLRTKQLRYTLEAFSKLYGRGLESKMACFRSIQNALGDANDCEVLLADKDRQLPSDIRGWLEKRADEKRKDFLRYWREEFDVKGADKEWERFLSLSPKRRPARKRAAKT
jgi:CHAD domain-containing protein